MRTYGRIIVTETEILTDDSGAPLTDDSGVVLTDEGTATTRKAWIEVATDAQGFDDYVWITTLIQCLKLNLGESPFYANYGIPAKPSVVQQVHPDYYVARTQQQFAPRFASLIVSKLPLLTPTYKISVTTNQGIKRVEEIPV